MCVVWPHEHWVAAHHPSTHIVAPPVGGSGLSGVITMMRPAGRGRERLHEALHPTYRAVFVRFTSAAPPIGGGSAAYHLANAPSFSAASAT
jgi:hypothetical protein